MKLFLKKEGTLKKVYHLLFNIIYYNETRAQANIVVVIHIVVVDIPIVEVRVIRVVRIVL